MWIKPRTRRAILRRLGDIFEDWAEALHRKAERPARPRPLAFPTDFEIMMSNLMSTTIHAMAKDIAFMRSPMWDRGTLIGQALKIRIPADYSPGRIDVD